MRRTIRSGSLPGSVELELGGRTTAAEMQAAVRALDEDDRAARPNLLLLVDLSELDTSPLSGGDLEDVAATALERDWYARPRAVAVVAPAEPTFSAAKLLRAHLGGSSSRWRVFRSRGDALAWLRRHCRG